MLTVIVQLTWSPATIGAVSSVLATTRSAAGVSGALAEAALFDVSGSALADATDAVLSSDPVKDESMVTPIVAAAESPADTSPTAQLMDPGSTSVQPGEEVAGSNVVPVGRASVMVTEPAVDGPALDEVRSQVVDDPGTGAGEGRDLASVRSLDLETVVVSDDELFEASGSA